MLGEIFYWVFNMSIAATICGIPVVLLRFIKKIPRRIFLWLWLIPFARMCFPIGISGKYGLMALLSRVTTKTVTVYQTDHGSALTMMNCVMGANSYFPITYKVRPLERVFSVAAVISSAVTLVMYLGEMILLNGHLYRFGDGLLFVGLPGIVLAPFDILVILLSGGITAVISNAFRKKEQHSGQA